MFILLSPISSQSFLLSVCLLLTLMSHPALSFPVSLCQPNPLKQIVAHLEPGSVRGICLLKKKFYLTSVEFGLHWLFMLVMLSQDNFYCEVVLLEMLNWMYVCMKKSTGTWIIISRKQLFASLLVSRYFCCPLLVLLFLVYFIFCVRGFHHFIIDSLFRDLLAFVSCSFFFRPLWLPLCVSHGLWFLPYSLCVF